MKNLDLFFPHLILILIVAIVATVAFVLHGDGITGGTPSYKVYVSTNQLPCLDTDPTNDIYVAGKVQLRNIEWLDYCTSGIYLHQFKCKSAGKKKLVGTFQCPHGCANGACLAG